MNSISGHFSAKLFGIYSMTKHSLIAFTDTLRRELADSSVKVCSIEPGYFKTNLTATDNICKIVNKVWNESSAEVKQYYGSPDKQIKVLIEFEIHGTVFARHRYGCR